MHDPYTPPHAPVATPTANSTATVKGIQRRRILLGAAGLYLGLTGWAILSMYLSLTIASWFDLAITTTSMDVIASTRTAVHFLVASAAYWWFAAGVRRSRLAHVLLAWTLVQILDALVIMVVMQVGLHRLAWQPVLLDLLPALAGWGLTWLWPGRRLRIAHQNP